MARGVQLGDQWRRLRLVQAFYEEQKTKLLMAQAIGHAAAKTENADQKIRDLANHLFPDEIDDQTVEEMQEVLEQEEEKEYFVEPLLED